jgi:hypothetical protein
MPRTNALAYFDLAKDKKVSTIVRVIKKFTVVEQKLSWSVCPWQIFFLASVFFVSNAAAYPKQCITLKGKLSVCDCKY